MAHENVQTTQGSDHTFQQINYLRLVPAERREETWTSSWISHRNDRLPPPAAKLKLPAPMRFLLGPVGSQSQSSRLTGFKILKDDSFFMVFSILINLNLI